MLRLRSLTKIFRVVNNAAFAGKLMHCMAMVPCSLLSGCQTREFPFWLTITVDRHLSCVNSISINGKCRLTAVDRTVSE